MPGFAKAEVEQMGFSLGIRESRRIRGLKTLDGKMVVQAVKQPDAIGHGFWMIDIHDPKGTGYTTWADQKPDIMPPVGDSYHIPLGMCLNPQIPNLAVVGRCASSTHEGHASVRLQSALHGHGPGRRHLRRARAQRRRGHGQGRRPQTPDAVAQRWRLSRKLYRIPNNHPMNKTISRILMSALAYVVSITWVAVQAAGFELVGPVQVPAGELECVRLAAADLVSDVHKITGKTLRVGDGDGTVVLASLNRPESVALLTRAALIRAAPQSKFLSVRGARDIGRSAKHSRRSSAGLNQALQPSGTCPSYFLSAATGARSG